jgi:hypothetical protein
MELEKFLLKRMGPRFSGMESGTINSGFLVKMGGVFLYPGGPTGVRMRHAITEWMEEDGMVGKWKRWIGGV